MKKVLKKAVKVTVIIALITIYFNIGWAIGSYLDRVQVTKTEQLTTFGKIVAGPDRFFLNYSERKGELKGPILASIFWPLVVIIFPIVSGGDWLVYGCYLGGVWAVFQIWAGIKFLLWFIFAGGAAKLLSLV